MVARISGVAMRHAKWGEPAGDEIAAAVAEIREVVGDRPDLLAEEAGILLGFHDGGLNEPRARSAAQLLIAAGADESLIPAWIEEGRRRAELRRHPPFNRDDSGKLQGLVTAAYGSQTRERRDDHQEAPARLLKPVGQLGTRQATARPSLTREIPRLQHAPSVAGQPDRSYRLPAEGPTAAIPGAPSWMDQMLSWLAENPPDAGVVYPLSAHPASSALSMRARAFKASLEPVTPPLRNARRDTGFPAAASLRAITRA